MGQGKRGGTFQKWGGIWGKDKSKEASASSASIVATGLYYIQRTDLQRYLISGQNIFHLMCCNSVITGWFHDY